MTPQNDGRTEHCLTLLSSCHEDWDLNIKVMSAGCTNWLCRGEIVPSPHPSLVPVRPISARNVLSNAPLLLNASSCARRNVHTYISEQCRLYLCFSKDEIDCPTRDYAGSMLVYCSSFNVGSPEYNDDLIEKYLSQFTKCRCDKIAH